MPTGTGRILVMDDEKSIRDLASEIMGLLGYEAVAAEDGAQAIELYTRSKRVRRLLTPSFWT